MKSVSPRAAMPRSAASPQMFTNRVSFSVPKLRETYRSVQPANGVSGPSSRSIDKASASDRGCNNVRWLIEPSIRWISATRTRASKATAEHAETAETYSSTQSTWKVVHHSFDPFIRKPFDVEIQQQSDRSAIQPQIRQH